MLIEVDGNSGKEHFLVDRQYLAIHPTATTPEGFVITSPSSYFETDRSLVSVLNRVINFSADPKDPQRRQLVQDALYSVVNVDQENPNVPSVLYKAAEVVHQQESASVKKGEPSRMDVSTGFAIEAFQIGLSQNPFDYAVWIYAHAVINFAYVYWKAETKLAGDEERGNNAQLWVNRIVPQLLPVDRYWCGRLSYVESLVGDLEFKNRTEAEAYLEQIKQQKGQEEVVATTEKSIQDWSVAERLAMSKDPYIVVGNLNWTMRDLRNVRLLGSELISPTIPHYAVNH